MSHICDCTNITCNITQGQGRVSDLLRCCQVDHACICREINNYTPLRDRYGVSNLKSICRAIVHKCLCSNHCDCGSNANKLAENDVCLAMEHRCTCLNWDKVSIWCKTTKHICRCLIQDNRSSSDLRRHGYIFVGIGPDKFAEACLHSHIYHFMPKPKIYNPRCPVSEHVCICESLVRYTSSQVGTYVRHSFIKQFDQRTGLCSLQKKQVDEPQMYKINPAQICKHSGQHTCICRVLSQRRNFFEFYAPFDCKMCGDHPCIKEEFAGRCTDGVCQCKECRHITGRMTKMAQKTYRLADESSADSATMLTSESIAESVDEISRAINDMFP